MALASNTMAHARNEKAPTYLDQAQGQRVTELRLSTDMQPVNAATDRLRAFPFGITIVRISVEHLRRARVLPRVLVTRSAGHGLNTHTPISCHGNVSAAAAARRPNLGGPGYLR